MIVKYFYERTDDDYKNYILEWDTCRDRLIFLHINTDHDYQIKSIEEQFNINKGDILAIRFPTYNEINTNIIINNVISGKGVCYSNNKIWYPKEIWIYNPVN